MPVQPIKIGSCFSGIGGFDLGVLAALPNSMLAWQIEKDSFCQKVLEKNFPGVTRYGEIESVDAGDLERADIVIGGWPCTDIAVCGKRAGLEGRESSLWWEMHRIIRDTRPTAVLLENSPGLTVRGLPEVLDSLFSSGLREAEWDTLCASSLGLPHLRERIYILAYTNRLDLRKLAERCEQHTPQRKYSESLHAGNQWALGGKWETLVRVYGSNYGVPDWVDRHRSIGNSVVPGLAYLTAKRLLQLAACNSAGDDNPRRVTTMSPEAMKGKPS